MTNYAWVWLTTAVLAILGVICSVILMKRVSHKTTPQDLDLILFGNGQEQ